MLHGKVVRNSEWQATEHLVLLLYNHVIRNNMDRNGCAWLKRTKTDSIKTRSKICPNCSRMF